MERHEARLSPRNCTESALEDPRLEAALIAEERAKPRDRTANPSWGSDPFLWTGPFDLRVMRPRAVDLRELWARTGQKVPDAIAASLGPQTPILLNHVVTPFAHDGREPGGVWALGYEFELRGIEANTISVLPSDEVLEAASVGQDVNVGVELGGGVGIPQPLLEVSRLVPGVALTGARIDVATHQRFQFALKFNVTVRKVVGAPVGAGGAVWKLYRQNERLDRPHPLLQTILVDLGNENNSSRPSITKFECVVKTWATQAGFLGTGFGARTWWYDDQEFTVALTRGQSTAAR